MTASVFSVLRRFQNISCYCLSGREQATRRSVAHFKTSHVIVYRGIVWRYFRRVNYFKTSHVIVYPNVLILVCWFNYYFKTSHVIVYQYSYIWSADGMIFQNISCYCLSYSVWWQYRTFLIFQNISCYCLSPVEDFLVMTVIYFKTSHVIVYLQRIRTRHSYPLISKHLMLLFILKDERDELKYMHFKTSYVIVYQQRFLGVQKLILDFKTSYVIVYRLCKCMGVTKQNNFKTSYVIVYLNSANHDSNNTEFQNILCYCLSSIFITSLIFLFISKHLMLLFICWPLPVTFVVLYFKTSYVIVYQSQLWSMNRSDWYFKTSYVIVYLYQRYR